MGNYKLKRRKFLSFASLLPLFMFNSGLRANDIYSILEMGAHGLVLAAETAVGKYPKECVIFLKKMVKIFMSNKR